MGSAHCGWEPALDRTWAGGCHFTQRRTEVRTMLDFSSETRREIEEKIYINLNSTSYGIFNSIILIQIKAFFHKN